VKGAILAVRGQPVRLCDALADSFPPQWDGTSFVLGDGVLWTDPGSSVLGSVIDGALVASLGDRQDPATGRPCAYGSPGPCSGFPSLSSTASVLWTDVPYSVLGTVRGGALTAPPSAVRAG